MPMSRRVGRSGWRRLRCVEGRMVRSGAHPSCTAMQLGLDKQPELCEWRLGEIRADCGKTRQLLRGAPEGVGSRGPSSGVASSGRQSPCSSEQSEKPLDQGGSHAALRVRGDHGVFADPDCSRRSRCRREEDRPGLPEGAYMAATRIRQRRGPSRHRMRAFRSWQTAGLSFPEVDMTSPSTSRASSIP